MSPIGRTAAGSRFSRAGRSRPPAGARSRPRSPNGPGGSTPADCSSTATTTSPGGSAPTATSRSPGSTSAKRLTDGQTDIPRLREGGVKAQFWSVYIPSEHPNPARTVTEQIDLVHRMVERYPDDLEMACSADDVERIVKSGKIASLIGIEGGVAIEDDLAQLRAFHRLGARYMTLTHNTTLDWADAATDEPSTTACPRSASGSSGR